MGEEFIGLGEYGRHDIPYRLGFKEERLMEEALHVEPRAVNLYLPF